MGLVFVSNLFASSGIWLCNCKTDV